MRAASTGNCRHPERATWLGHHAWWLLIITNVVFSFYVLTVLLVNGRPLMADERGGFWEGSITLPGLFVIALVIFQVVLSRRARVHDRSLCARCIEAVPLDPQQAVERKDFQLRAVHIADTYRRAAVYLVVTLTLTIGSVALVVATIWRPVPVPLLVGAVVWLGFIGGCVLPYLIETHRRLDPWCPYCHDEDDGFPDAIPEPSPDPQIKADR